MKRLFTLFLIFTISEIMYAATPTPTATPNIDFYYIKFTQEVPLDLTNPDICNTTIFEDEQRINKIAVVSWITATVQDVPGFLSSFGGEYLGVTKGSDLENILKGNYIISRRSGILMNDRTLKEFDPFIKVNDRTVIHADGTVEIEYVTNTVQSYTHIAFDTNGRVVSREKIGE